MRLTDPLPLTLSHILAFVALCAICKTKRLPSRETIINPKDERVVLLGASSGVGRDLALIYARRGAKLCLFARRKHDLDLVKDECEAIGAGEVIVIAGDISSPEDLLAVRKAATEAWGGIDTLHILAGVPSTSTLLDIAGSPLEADSGSSSNPHARRLFTSETSLAGLERVKAEATACANINFIGTTLALATFLPTLSRSRSPVLHHLSSVSATIPAPRRTLYAATKAAGLHAVESCRVECEAAGVRFLSVLPGTIDNGFRQKHALDGEKGECEVQSGIKHSWEKLLLPPQKVVQVIMDNISLNPAPAPLVPFWPFSAISALRLPPKHLIHLPWQYRVAFLLRDTPLGWIWLEPAARRKYGL